MSTTTEPQKIKGDEIAQSDVSQVYWGDRIALPIWLFFFILLGVMAILDVVRAMRH